jgi:hypothetical protein
MTQPRSARHYIVERDSLWGTANVISDAQAEEGSTRLRHRILGAISRFEKRHGLKRGEGRTLLLNTGVHMPRVLERHRREEERLAEKLEREAAQAEWYPE